LKLYLTGALRAPFPLRIAIKYGCWGRFLSPPYLFARPRLSELMHCDEPETSTGTRCLSPYLSFVFYEACYTSFNMDSPSKITSLLKHICLGIFEPNWVHFLDFASNLVLF